MAESEVVNVNPNEIPLIPEVPEAEHPGGIEMTEWVFTNDKANPNLRMLFHGLYQGAFSNQLGIMTAKRLDNGEVDTLIVGVELTENGPQCHPLAIILTPEQVDNYVAPDGSGGYIS